MNEANATAASLNQQLDAARYRLETLGASTRLAERDKIDLLERRLRALVAPQAGLIPAETAQGA
jgi:hypothetical protein